MTTQLTNDDADKDAATQTMGDNADNNDAAADINAAMETTR
jgi:hypothetical protein